MTWKNIVGFNGDYKISDSGEVESLKGLNKRILKSGINGAGYKYFGLSKKNLTINFRVHRLVAIYYVPNPNNYNEVNHINGNKLDNRACNLEWVSPSQNIKHAYRTGLIKNRNGINNPNSKISESTAIMIKKLIKKGLFPTAISKKLNISKELIRAIYRGKTWKHLNVH